MCRTCWRSAELGARARGHLPCFPRYRGEVRVLAGPKLAARETRWPPRRHLATPSRLVPPSFPCLTLELLSLLLSSIPILEFVLKKYTKFQNPLDSPDFA